MFLMLLFSYLYPDAIDYEKNKYDVPMLKLGKILAELVLMLQMLMMP